MIKTKLILGAILMLALNLYAKPPPADLNYYTVKVDITVRVETSDIDEAFTVVSGGWFGPGWPVDFVIGSYWIDSYNNELSHFIQTSAIIQVMARNEAEALTFPYYFYTYYPIPWGYQVTGTQIVNFSDVAH